MKVTFEKGSDIDNPDCWFCCKPMVGVAVCGIYRIRFCENHSADATEMARQKAAQRAIRKGGTQGRRERRELPVTKSYNTVDPAELLRAIERHFEKQPPEVVVRRFAEICRRSREVHPDWPCCCAQCPDYKPE